jgi:hypothetical protein
MPLTEDGSLAGRLKNIQSEIIGVKVKNFVEHLILWQSKRNSQSKIFSAFLKSFS